MPTRRFRQGSLVVAVALAASSGAGAVPTASAAASAFVTPPCDAIPGETTALSERWRAFFVETGTDEESSARLLACRRTPGPAREVVYLGTRTATEMNCDCIDVEAIDGDRLLVRTSFSSQYGGTSSYSLFDVENLRLAPLGERREASLLALLPGGGLLWNRVGAGPLAGPSPTMLEDAAGPAVLSDQPVADLARSSDGSVVYALRADGVPLKVSGGGAAPLEWVDAPTLKTQRNDARVRRTASRVKALGHRGSTDLGVVEERRAGRLQRSIAYLGQRLPIRRSGAVSLVAMATDLAVIRAPFPGSVGRSVRAFRLGARAKMLSRVDLPSDPSALAVASGGVLARASSNHITVTGPVRATFDVAGARDLAIALLATGTQEWERVYATDGGGTVRTFETPRRAR